MNSESWNEYVTHALHQTQEADRQPLGGTRPEYTVLENSSIGADEDSTFKSLINNIDSKGRSNEEEKNINDSGDSYNDQVNSSV